MRKRYVVMLVACAVAASVAATAAIAGSRTHQPGQTVNRRITAPTVLTGKSITNFKVVRERSTDFFTSSTCCTGDKIPGFKLSMTVPANTHAIFDARFAAESVCYGASGYCEVYILLDGKSMGPTTAYAFDSNDGGTEGNTSWTGCAMERTAKVGPGTHTIQVVAYNSAGSMSFELSEMSLAVDQIKV